MFNVGDIVICTDTSGQLVIEIEKDKESWFVGYELPEDFDFKGMRVFAEALEEIEDSWLKRLGVYGTVRAVKHVY